MSLFLDIRSRPKGQIQNAALPHHLTKYTPPGGGLTAVVIVMVTAQIHQGVEFGQSRKAFFSRAALQKNTVQP